MADIEFTTFEATEKPNPYVEAVENLAKADDVNAAAAITVDVNDAQREQGLFQKAANKIGKTARLRMKDESNVTVKGEGEDAVKSGTVRLVFTLTEKHKVRRGKKD